MNTDREESNYKDFTERIIAVAYEVSNTLGCGFLEKVYENALAVGLAEHGLSAAQQTPARVIYRDQTVGDYVADLIVENAVLVEVKATLGHHDVHAAQVLNYLKAPQLPVGLLLNFGRPKLMIRRFVLGERLKNLP